MADSAGVWSLLCWGAQVFLTSVGAPFCSPAVSMGTRA